MIDLNIPRGAASHLVSVIDSTTTAANIRVTHLIQPGLPDKEVMPPLPAFSFLVTDSTGKRKVLFDLATRKDLAGFPPANKEFLVEHKWDFGVEKDVSEIIEEHGVPPNDIEAIIWSGRDFIELDFTGPDSFKIGQFPAIDYFGDGSFYLLDAPGHAPGHICGLVRTKTSSEDGDTFIMLAADAIHHAGELRPSEHRPLPAEISPNPLAPVRADNPCHRRFAALPFRPGPALEHVQTSRNRQPVGTRPFFDPALTIDAGQAHETIRWTQEVDSRDDVFILSAHDETALGVIDFFPLPANDWKAKSWADAMRWRFLKDLGGAAAKDFAPRDCCMFPH
ncbi:hypothetical protein KEM52_003932 [Ascosphaera acerosa]|nr:hypothetical protein KEM52_003932 [Ascosphaera acerosa]